MISVATDQGIIDKISTKKESRKYTFLTCFFLATLVLGRVVNNAILYIFSVISVFVFGISSVASCFSFLLFLLPLSPILKSDVDGISIFTILFFLFILKLILVKKKLGVKFLIFLLLYVLYGLIFSGLSEIKTVITMACGMIMLYCLRTININIYVSILTFSFGIIYSSILALLRNVFPTVNDFIIDSAIKLGNDEYFLRFSGLQGNPNYYTLDITISLAAIVLLMYKGSTNLIHIICFIILSIFGLMSVSQSFVLCWVLLIAFWFIISAKKGIVSLLKFLFIAIICCIVIYFYAYDVVNAYILRFTLNSKSSLDSITTGRANIWGLYIRTIFNETKVLFCGNGLNSIIEGAKGAHNTYLEAFFSLGIVGCCLFCLAIKYSMGKIISKLVMLIPIFLLLIRMFAIGILTYDNLWFYLAIILGLSKLFVQVRGLRNEKIHRVDNI